MSNGIYNFCRTRSACVTLSLLISVAVFMLFNVRRIQGQQEPKPGGSSPAGAGNGVLAQVNDEVILHSDVLSRIKPRLRQLARGASKNEYRKKRQQLFLKSVSFMIEEKVLTQEAKEQGLSVSDQEIQEKKQELIEQAGSKQAFKQGLHQQGLTVKMWERQVRTNLLNRKLFREKFKKSGSSFFVTPEEMKSYYNKNKLQFYREAKVKGHVVSFPFSSSAERDQMVRLARTVLDQIKDGASFSAIVDSYRELDPEHTRSFDWTKKGEFPRSIEYQLFNRSSKKSVRGPFVAGDRVVILKRTGKIKAKQSPLTDPEVQKEIRTQLRQKKRKQKLQEIKQKLIDQAYIYPRYLLES